MVLLNSVTPGVDLLLSMGAGSGSRQGTSIDDIRDRSSLIATMSERSSERSLPATPKTYPYFFNSRDRSPDRDKNHDRSQNQDQMPRNIYYYCAIAAMTSLSFGYYLGIISAVMIALPYAMRINNVDAGHIAGVSHIGAAMGASLCGYLMDMFGRRPILIWNSIPFLIAGVWMSNSTSVANLVIGRLICGLAVGTASVSAAVYISEMAPTHLRGKLGVLTQVAITLGIILSYAMGYLVVKFICRDCWQYMFVIGLILPVMSLFLTLFFLPETPRWLISHRRDGEAMTVLLNIYGVQNDDLAQEEYFRQFVQFERDRGIQSHWADLLDRKYAWHLTISITLNILQQLTGFNVITYYSATLFHQMGYMDADALVWSMATALPQLSAVLLAVHLLERNGRRQLLLVSSLGVCCMLVILGFSTLPFMSEHQLWLALICIVVFRCFFSIGLGPVPSILSSEILPYQIRARGLSLASALNWIVNYIITANFLAWVDAVGITYVYLIYACFALVTFVFTWLVIPETKGKSLEELERDTSQYASGFVDI